MPHGRTTRRELRLETLEHRLCLSASQGWDGPGQGSAELLYYVDTSQIGNGLTETEYRAAIDEALKAWSDVADIEFRETSVPNQRDAIDIEFKRLDGPGGTLAQAYFPDDVNRNPIAGDIQFDTAERWEVGNGAGSAAFDLVLVAAHEIGHALGLNHSGARDAVLRASVSAREQFRELAADDVDHILDLYAAAESPPSQTVPPLAQPVDPPADSSSSSQPDANVPGSEQPADPGADGDEDRDDDRRFRRRRFLWWSRGRFGFYEIGGNQRIRYMRLMELNRIRVEFFGGVNPGNLDIRPGFWR